jgi:hypothetical protein
MSLLQQSPVPRLSAKMHDVVFLGGRFADPSEIERRLRRFAKPCEVSAMHSPLVQRTLTTFEAAEVVPRDAQTASSNTGR